jgi:hypothetical protein
MHDELVAKINLTVKKFLDRLEEMSDTPRELQAYATVVSLLSKAQADLARDAGENDPVSNGILGLAMAHLELQQKGKSE